MSNKGFDVKVIAQFQSELDAAGGRFLPVAESENSDEFCHFRFIGKFEGRPVIYDTILTTLRLEHELELYDLAEQLTAEHFPKWNRNDEFASDSSELQDAVGLHMAEIILGLQEEGAIKVQEHLDIDTEVDFGVGLDVGLQIETITTAVIEKFITQFNEDKIVLDETLYSFQLADED